jgi:hypothetical protein
MADLTSWMTAVLPNAERKSGDSYMPEASFKADSCSGIFKIKIQSSSNPELVERRIFDALATFKESIDAKELQRSATSLNLNGARIPSETFWCG